MLALPPSLTTSIPVLEDLLPGRKNSHGFLTLISVVLNLGNFGRHFGLRKTANLELLAPCNFQTWVGMRHLLVNS